MFFGRVREIHRLSRVRMTGTYGKQTVSEIPASRWRRSLVACLDRLPIATRRTLILSHDGIVAATSVPLAAALRLGGFGAGEPVWGAMPWMVPLFVALFATTGWALGLHRCMWRYASVNDLLRLTAVIGGSVSAFSLAIVLVNRFEGIPRTLPVIQFGLLLLLLGGSRLGYRLLREGTAFPVRAKGAAGEGRVPVLLLGLGRDTALTIRSLRQSRDRFLDPVGILVPENEQARGREVLGVPVLGTLAEFRSIVESLRQRGDTLTRAILTERLPPETVTTLVEESNRLQIRLLRAPDPLAFREASDGRAPELRPITLEDLLERPPVVLDHAAIDGFLRNRRVLITGAGGSIGSELVRQIAMRAPASLVLLDNSEYNLFEIDREIRSRYSDLDVETVLCDVRDHDRVQHVVAETAPQLVFHAAALKHVPLVELNPREGVLTNVIGTRNVAETCLRCGVEAMILVSTDKAVNPTSVMGATKRLAELWCQALDREGGEWADGAPRHPRFLTVRFGNVLGSSGSVVPIFQKQLAAGGPLTVTHPEIERFFMTIPEAVSLLLHASAFGYGNPDRRGCIFVLDMGRPVRVVDIARKLIRLSGLEPDRDIRIVFTGLRPGEKLYEELFDRTETRLDDAPPGLHIATSRALPVDRLREAIARLEREARAGNVTRVVEELSRIVPGYRPHWPPVLPCSLYSRA